MFGTTATLQLENKTPSGSLGNTANISARASKSVKKYTLLGHAQKLLTDANVLSKRSGKEHRTRTCLRNRSHGSESITINMKRTKQGMTASYGGLQTCESIWACPVCASRIAVEKGEQVLKALEWAKQENLAPAMIALTASHDAGMSLRWFMEKFKAAWEMFSGHSRWRKFKKKYGIKHYIANREVTRGNNGWHYHMHLLLFLDFGALKSSEETNLQTDLETLWLECLEHNRLSGIEGIALNVSAHKNVGQTYLTKIGITINEKDGKLEYEMTSTETKKGKSIWDILRHSYYGDEAASALYIEFVQAMQDTNFITLSHGLPDLLEDIQLPALEEAAAAAEEASTAWAEIAPWAWKVIRRSGAMGKVLEQAIIWQSVDHLREMLANFLDEQEKPDVWVFDSDNFKEGIRRINHEIS
jgi:hypothetical protein